MTNVHPTIRAALARFVKPAEKGNMNPYTCNSVEALSESELCKEEERLEELIRRRNATVRDADRLAEVRAALRRIRAVRDGRSNSL